MLTTVVIINGNNPKFTLFCKAVLPKMKNLFLYLISDYCYNDKKQTYAYLNLTIFTKKNKNLQKKSNLAQLYTFLVMYAHKDKSKPKIQKQHTSTIFAKNFDNFYTNYLSLL